MFRLSYEFVCRVRNPTSKVCGLKAELWNGKVSEENNILAIRNPKNLDVEKLTLNTNSNVLNQATKLACN